MLHSLKPEINSRHACKSEHDDDGYSNIGSDHDDDDVVFLVDDHRRRI